MGRPRKDAQAEAPTTPKEAPLPARHLLPALLAKAKADGDQALIDRLLAACSE